MKKLLVLLSIAVAAGCASSYTAEVSQKVVDGKVQVTYTDEEAFDESTNLQRFAQWNKELSYCPSTYTVKSTSTTSDRFTITVMCD